MQCEIKHVQDSTDSSYETALCRAFEELRLKRKIERKNEKVIYSLLQAKYDLEKQIEEERRNVEKEKKQHEAQLDNYRKELSQRDHTIQCNMKNQQTVSKMFEKEIASLREELKAMHMNYLNLEKKCHEFETAAKLYQNLKDAALKRINEVQQTQDYLKRQMELLKTTEDQLQETVTYVYTLAEERDFANKHLLEIMAIMGKRIHFLSEELIKSESKLKYIAATSLPSENNVKTPKLNENNKVTDSPQLIALSREVNHRHQQILDILSSIHKLHFEFTEIEKRKVDSKDAAREEEMEKLSMSESPEPCTKATNIEKDEG